MAFLKDFFRWLTNQTVHKDRLLTPLGDETEWNKEKKELIKYQKSLEGQIAKTQADKRQKKFDDKNLIDEIDLVKELKSKADKIEAKRYEGLYSLNSLFNKLAKNKKLKIELVDKDDHTVLDYFKDFVVLSNGNIGIRGVTGDVWIEGKTLSHIIWKPETLATQIRRKRIQLAYDKDFQIIPDLEKVMMPEIKYDEDDGEFYESEEVMRPFKEMLMEKTKEINNLLEDKVYLEKTNELYNKKIQQIERAFKVLKQRAEIGDSETSKAIESNIDSLKAVGKMARDNIILQDQKLTSDELKDNKEQIITELATTLEDEKSKTSEQKARDVYEKLILFTKKHLGDTTIVHSDTSETQSAPIKPGQSIK